MTEFGLPFELPQKLSVYLETTERETGRKIQFQFADDVGLSGMSAAFQDSPSNILVYLPKRIKKLTPEIEHSIAHEVTHGLLIYKLGYCRPFPKQPIYPIDIKNISLVGTMIDDIIVNKKISEAGFSPFAPIYLYVVKEEIKAAKDGIDYYRQFSGDPVFKFRFMVLRYITAWAFTKYFNLKPSEIGIIGKFLKTFSKSFPTEYDMASNIKGLIIENDIFTVGGHRKVVEGIYKLWHLEALVEPKPV
jgi:hypothetical protein